jgi:hypothetical protein
MNLQYTGVAPGANLVDAKVCGPFGCPESSILAALHWAVTEQHAAIVNMSLGGPDTPETDPVEQAVLGETVTYHNHGGTTVSLQLEVQAPPGMFAIDRASLTVPPGGTAELTLTADTRASSPDGFHGGHLVAIAGGAVTRTPFALEKEVESYDVTVEHTDRTGQPTDLYTTLIAQHDSGVLASPYDPDGTVEVRLPKGRYFVFSLVFGDDPTDPSEPLPTSYLLRPRHADLRRWVPRQSGRGRSQ